MASFFDEPADGSPTTVTHGARAAETLSAREAADGARHAADDAMSLLRCMFEAADESQKRELRAMIGDVRRQQREGEIDGVTSTLALRARVILGRERWHGVVQQVKASAEARASAKRRALDGAGAAPADGQLALLVARRHAASQRAKAARRAARTLAVIEERPSDLSSGSEASPTTSPQPRSTAGFAFEDAESPHEGQPEVAPAVEI